jgi:hypothetical protein
MTHFQICFKDNKYSFCRSASKSTESSLAKDSKGFVATQSTSSPAVRRAMNKIQGKRRVVALPLSIDKPLEF